MGCLFSRYAIDNYIDRILIDVIDFVLPAIVIYSKSAWTVPLKVKKR